MTAWNIHGLKDKLETDWLSSILRGNDFVFLTETKTSETPSLSGFKVINNPAKASHRGGLAVLIKNYMFRNVCKIDKSYEGLIVFELDNLPFVTFILCYIAPDDSPYYDKAVFGQLHNLLNKDSDNVFIILGDFNARIATPDLSSVCSSLEYPSCKDGKTNRNGELLINLCKDNNLVILNNLQKGDKISRHNYHTGKAKSGYQNSIIV